MTGREISDGVELPFPNDIISMLRRDGMLEQQGQYRWAKYRIAEAHLQEEQ